MSVVRAFSGKPLIFKLWPRARGISIFAHMQCSICNIQNASCGTLLEERERRKKVIVMEMSDEATALSVSVWLWACYSSSASFSHTITSEWQVMHGRHVILWKGEFFMTFCICSLPRQFTAYGKTGSRALHTVGVLLPTAYTISRWSLHIIYTAQRWVWKKKVFDVSDTFRGT